MESMAKLKPVFKPDGTVTAGNASGMNDAGSAVVLMSAEKAEELAPYIEAAFKRKKYLEPLADADIPAYEAYGLTVTQPIDLDKMPEANRRRILTFRRMREIMEGR